jgi:hypothetical protein
MGLATNIGESTHPIQIKLPGSANFLSNRRIAMKTVVNLGAIALVIALTGCETTNSIPYKASTSNIISIQQTLHARGKKVSLGAITLAPGVEESPLCRLMGPVVVAPGKTLPQYIKEAFQEELFMAQVYQADAPSVIEGRLEALKFSSITPASWDITLSVKSNASNGYTVVSNYPFDTSFTAYSACKNVADAFGPAVQNLIKQVVDNPKFIELAQ